MRYLLALSVLAFLCYHASLQGQFVFDDQQVISQNTGLMAVHKWKDAWNLGTDWRRLLMFSYGLNFYYGGMDPKGYHLVNVLLHILNVLLVFGIVKMAKASTFAAFAGAAAFAVHPLLSGAVDYVSGRSSVMCATFYFASILCIMKAREN